MAAPRKRTTTGGKAGQTGKGSKAAPGKKVPQKAAGGRTAPRTDAGRRRRARGQEGATEATGGASTPAAPPVLRQGEGSGPDGMVLCGDLGCRTTAGEPCRKGARIRPPSHPEAGTAEPCADHDPATLALLQAHKEEVLHRLGHPPFSIHHAAQAIGRDPATIWRWRQADPAFDRAFADALAKADEGRVAMVEDALYLRALSPKGTVDGIFFLKNRAPDRWKDRQHHAHGGPEEGVPIPVDVTHRQVWKVGDKEIPWV